VLRVWDNELFKETEAVVEKILGELNTVQPNPSARARVYGWNK